MDWGKANRIKRIIRPKTGRTVMLAVDHGYFLGPTTGVKIPKKDIMPLAPYADCLMLTRGVLRTSIDPKIDNPIVLRVSGGNSILSEELSDEGIGMFYGYLSASLGIMCCQRNQREHNRC